MKVVYHKLAVSDVRLILDHYESTVGDHLADRFYRELIGTITQATENPRHFPPLTQKSEKLRRANLRNFPYHFLYEENLWGIKVMVIRHHRRNPKFGLRRQ